MSNGEERTLHENSRLDSSRCALAAGSTAREDSLCKGCAYAHHIMGTNFMEGWCYMFRERVPNCRKYCPAPRHLRERSNNPVTDAEPSTPANTRAQGPRSV